MQWGILNIIGPASRLLLFALLYLAICCPALADKRVALVIGNSAYANVPRLGNPANDARLMADTLRALGFALVGGGAQIDLDKAKFDNAVQSFGNQLPGADVALFYYAGHGVQVRGSNYLVPVSANPTKEADVDFQMIDVALVLRQMEGSGTKLNLVILDACRNNPFGGRGLRATAGGLAQMQAPEGTLISYATQPGNVAQDGSDGDSPYTKALAETIKRPGLGIFDAFNDVGLAVKRSTGGAQQPWVSSSPIDGSFYFASPSPAPSPAGAPVANEAATAWGVIQNTGSVAVLEDFIRQFGSTIYGSMARARLDELKKSQVVLAAPPAPLTTSPPPVQPVAVAPPSRLGSPCGDAPLVGVSLASRPAEPLSSAEECALKPKDSFKECPTCPVMVKVPAGRFTMGSPNNEFARSPDESPQHRVTLSKPFAVGRFVVTFDEWDACVADGGCNGYKPADQGWGRGRRPIINVSWDDIKTYLAWLSRKTGKAYRPLTESEWEYAARAGTMTAFYWGKELGSGNANCAGCGSKWDNRQTSTVGSFAANALGLYDMAGNVWEIVEDSYHDSYNGAPTDGSAWTTGDRARHVMRGGSWGNGQWPRPALRFLGFSSARENNSGFRVGRTLTP